MFNLNPNKIITIILIIIFIVLLIILNNTYRENIINGKPKTQLIEDNLPNKEVIIDKLLQKENNSNQGKDVIINNDVENFKNLYYVNYQWINRVNLQKKLSTLKEEQDLFLRVTNKKNFIDILNDLNIWFDKNTNIIFYKTFSASLSSKQNTIVESMSKIKNVEINIFNEGENLEIDKLLDSYNKWANDLFIIIPTDTIDSITNDNLKKYLFLNLFFDIRFINISNWLIMWSISS